MLLSMTGYGRVVKEFDQKAISVEIKSLNSKYLDLKLKIPQNYRVKELDIRKILTPKLLRGKVDILIDVKNLGDGDNFTLNKALFKTYYTQLSAISQELGIAEEGILQTIIRLPNVVEAVEEKINGDEWTFVAEVLKEALVKLQQFRRDEGDSMEQDLSMRVNNIADCIEEVKEFEVERKTLLKKRLAKNFEDVVPKEAIDSNRFEQEVLYYLEKLDITEEKIRLKQHCEYFLKELKTNKTSKGKKLNFISQEMGREINTMGSKANFSAIQHIVVKMKDNLEKIKEQVANAL